MSFKEYLKEERGKIDPEEMKALEDVKAEATELFTKLGIAVDFSNKKFNGWDGYIFNVNINAKNYEAQPNPEGPRARELGQGRWIIYMGNDEIHLSSL